jgi:hypothetical protein
MKNYIFGDTGGHAKQLFASLEKIGVNLKDYTIPEGVRIIHCGDLIHKGPSSRLLLNTVNRLIRKNKGQWIQLLGNHEFQHIEGSPYFWRCDCDMQDVATINNLFDEGLAMASFGLDKLVDVNLEVTARPKIVIPDNGVLFTHAGLTNTWLNFVKSFKVLNEASPNLASINLAPTEVAYVLNSLDVDVITAAGKMLGYINPRVGPVWAIGNDEVFIDWNDSGETMPFMQVHGHTTSYMWTRGSWYRKDSAFKSFREATKLNPQTRTVITKLAGNVLVGIDPGFSAKADLPVQPYLELTSLK